MVRTKDNTDLPSATALSGNGRGTSLAIGARKSIPTVAKKNMLEEKNKSTEESIAKVTEKLDDVLISAKLPKESDEINLETMEDLTCDSMDSLAVNKVKNMYARYQLQWKLFVEKKKVKDEYDDTKILEFFKSIRKKYAPSTLWVIYSCLNAHFIDKFGKDLKHLPRLTRYLKQETHRYVAKQSKVFKPEEIHTVLMFCVNSKDPQHTLLGITVSLMYYGLLRSTDVLKINLEDVTVNGEKIEVKFNHTRKRVNYGFTFWVPALYLPLYNRYFVELRRSGAGRNSRFLKNYNKRSQTRTIGTGKNKILTFIKMMCQILGKRDSSGFSTHAFRRSAATNLADAGVSLVNLKRHGQWKSDATAERYIANSLPIRKERVQKLLPRHLQVDSLAPSLRDDFSSSESEESYDSPIHKLRSKPFAGVHHSPPAVAKAMSWGAPVTPAPSIKKRKASSAPAKIAYNPYKKAATSSPEVIVLSSDDETVYAIDGTPVRVSKSWLKGGTTSFTNCTFNIENDKKKKEE